MSTFTTKLKIEVGTEYGSEFQAKTAHQSLILMLQSWMQFTQGAHKKNKVEIFINNEPLKPYAPVASDRDIKDRS